MDLAADRDADDITTQQLASLLTQLGPYRALCVIAQHDRPMAHRILSRLAGSVTLGETALPTASAHHVDAC